VTVMKDCRLDDCATGSTGCVALLLQVYTDKRDSNKNNDSGYYANACCPSFLTSTVFTLLLLHACELLQQRAVFISLTLLHTDKEHCDTC
jgi:hypothetical protein